MVANIGRNVLILISALLFIGVILDLSNPDVLPPGLINQWFRILPQLRHYQLIATYLGPYHHSPNGQIPPHHENSGRLVSNDHSSSTRDCAISRTPGQHMLFEQTLLDFKRQHPGRAPILIVVPVSGPPAVLADMTSQVIHFTKLFGHGRVLVSFGLAEDHEDDLNNQIKRTSEALFTAKILHNLRSTTNLDDWTHRTLEGYRSDFEVAVILRGVICAADLARLVIHTIENKADMACSVDLTFSPGHRVATSSGNLDFVTGAPIPTQDLIRATRFVQAQCCDGSVKVIRFGGIYSHGLSAEPCRPRGIRSEEFVLSENSTDDQQSQPRIMISPSVKSSPDHEDFRSAMQLGFMNLQGFDYRPMVWGQINR